jgi:hypothetical protein
VPAGKLTELGYRESPGSLSPAGTGKRPDFAWRASALSSGHRTLAVANGCGEPSGEPTTADAGLCQATASYYRCR